MGVDGYVCVCVFGCGCDVCVVCVLGCGGVRGLVKQKYDPRQTHIGEAVSVCVCVCVCVCVKHLPEGINNVSLVSEPKHTRGCFHSQQSGKG